MTKAFLLLALACSLPALNVVPITDISGDGSAHPISTTVKAALWVQMVVPSGNGSTPVRWGDSTITTSKGGTIAAGGGQFLPPTGNQLASYDLTQIYYLVQSGDKLSIVWGQ